MNLRILPLLITLAATAVAAAEPYADRFVWVFGWNLAKDSDTAEVTQLLETAGKSGMNGAVVSSGLDTLCKKREDYLRRLDAVKQACERNKLELIPAIFSVGYGGAALSHDRNLAEGLGVEDAAFIVKGSEARFAPDPGVRLANGGFEESAAGKFAGLRLQDQPGSVSFVDTQVKHAGQSSLRLENFTANPHGHGRMMQEIRVRPHRSYRITLWVKTENLQPVSGFRVQVLAGERTLAPRSFKVSPTADWQKLTMIFNSLDLESVKLYAGLWGGKSGKLWIDDLAIEELGPLNVLHRPGTPVTVKSEDGSITYTQGQDYAPLVDPKYNVSDVDREPVPLKVLPGGRIKDGQRLRVSWYHSMVINDSQVTVCMAEPALYEIWEHEAKLLAQHVRPKRVLLNMDEVRMGGTCQACKGRNMGELLGECITKQAEILRRHIPGVQVYIWSDMLDPTHNAKGNYYLVAGDFTGSWKHVPRDLTIAVWGGPPREKSLAFFAEQGCPVLVACYYDAADLSQVKQWLAAARQTPNVRGFMYTPWQRKYALLPAFGELLRDQPPK